MACDYKIHVNLKEKLIYYTESKKDMKMCTHVKLHGQKS